MKIKPWMNFIANELGDCNSDADLEALFKRARAHYTISPRELKEFITKLDQAYNTVKPADKETIDMES